MNEQHLSQIPLARAAGGKIGQVAFLVSDMKQALETWGIGEHRPQWRVWEYSPELIPVQSYLGEPATYSMMLAMNGADPQLELIEPLTGPSIYHTWLAEGRSGIHHLGYYVEDLQAVSLEMERAGFAVVMTGEGHGADGTGRFAYYDTLELLGCYLEGIETPTARRDPLYTWPEG